MPGTVLSGMRVLGLHLSERAVTVVAALLELAIAAPFLGITPGEAAGVPNPLMFGVCMAASYLLDVRTGLALTALGAALAVLVLDANPYIVPVLWLALSAVVGRAGDRIRCAEEERETL